MSRSWMVCVHLYGKAACSASSFALASLSSFSRSEGVGEPSRAILAASVVLSDSHSVEHLVKKAAPVGALLPGGMLQILLPLQAELDNT